MLRFAVIGLGRFGMQLTRSLTEAGVDVVAIDNDRDHVEQARDYATLAIRLDATDEEAMRAQGLSEVDVGVIGIGHDFEAAALTTALLKTLRVPKVIARASTTTQARILRSIGADDIVYPEGESATRWANQLLMFRVRNLVELGEGHSLVWITAPQVWHHKTPHELRLRQKHHVNLVAISRAVKPDAEEDALRHTSTVIIVPGADEELLPDDILIMAGANDALSSLPSD
ncbi:MAG: TrkA family potassium uptake protein [Phycisphaerales bacterium]|nr:MAG: TrkA family potassium uptake protein [Phycisphaerales bacterium]